MKKKTLDKNNLLTLIQRRVANGVIGASTLRNQGAKGIVKTAREYLSYLNLEDFKDIPSQDKFNRLLNTRTEELKKKFPKGAKNWGTARKALNVFLMRSFFDRFLTKTYQLDKLEKFLEIPLDGHVVNCLKKDDKKNKLPKWEGIKNLKKEDSNKYQEYAKGFAEKEGYKARIYLDLIFWRSDDTFKY
jgi:hypothetical protein